MATREKDRGAAAVEFALVFPLVMMLLITVLEFSRVWNIQATLTDAAMISARYAAVHGAEPDADPAVVSEAAKTEAKNVPSFVDWASATTFDVEVDCEVEMVATSFISVSPGSLTEWFSTAIGSPLELNASGKMPCDG